MGRKSSLYLNGELEKKIGLGKRNGLSEAINIIADRYTLLVEREQKGLLIKFTEGEWDLMRDACNGTVFQPAFTLEDSVLANVEDSLDSQFEYFGADRDEVTDKLRGLSLLQQIALVEEIEDWWAQNG